jgi:hypothetical protein
MASADEPLSASLDAPTDPLMGNNSQHLSDESRPGDRLTFYTALVCVPVPPCQSLTPDRSLGLRIGK